MRIKFIILLIILPFFIFSESLKSIYFNGSFIFNEESGISVIPAKNDDIILITSLKYHYAVILPYAENWEITFDEKNVLLANNKIIYVTLELLKSDDKSSEQYLKKIMQDLLENKDKNYIIETEIFYHNNDHVLVTVVDTYSLMNDDKYKGIVQLNYYATKTYRDERFQLHMSFMQKKSKVELINIPMFDYLTIGFNLDFAR